MNNLNSVQITKVKQVLKKARTLIVNRQLMQEHKINEATIQFIQNKARIFKGVNVFDRMITTGKGYINSAPHFDLNEMIEAQKDFTTKVRSSSVVRNEEVLKILEDMRDSVTADMV